MKTYLDTAKEVLNKEIEGIEKLLNNMPADFERAAKAISDTKGRLIVSGIGKSGYIGQKISASFASTGTRSFYVHPAEASHGDLGMIGDDDIVMLLSNSGETKELLDIITYCKRFSIPIIGITMQTDSILARSSSYLLNIPKVLEASSVNAPTTSSTMMLALGDSLVVAIHEYNGFSNDDFAIFHPGGKLGSSLLKIESLMHKEGEVPFVFENDSMDKAILQMTSRGFGCTAVLDKSNSVVGIITDGDLRRHMGDDLLAMKSSDVMTSNPILIQPDYFAGQALAVMNKNNVTTLLVTKDNKLCGIVHVHDLLRAGVK